MTNEATNEQLTIDALGGPAFPFSFVENDIHHWAQGIWVRDYFAANAPPPPAGWMGGMANAKTIATWRWHYADEMMRQRAGGTNGAGPQAGS